MILRNKIIKIVFYYRPYSNGAYHSITKEKMDIGNYQKLILFKTKYAIIITEQILHIKSYKLLFVILRPTKHGYQLSNTLLNVIS